MLRGFASRFPPTVVGVTGTADTGPPRTRSGFV